MEIIKNFEGAIDSPSYRIIKEAIIEHKKEWKDSRWRTQEDFALYIIKNYNGITVIPETVSIYVGDILTRLGLKNKRIEDSNPYTVKELKEFLNDEISCLIVINIISNVFCCGWDEEMFNKIVEMNKEIISEEKYNKLMMLDRERLKCGYIKYGNKKIRNIIQWNKILK